MPKGFPKKFSSGFFMGRVALCRAGIGCACHPLMNQGAQIAPIVIIAQPARSGLQAQPAQRLSLLPQGKVAQVRQAGGCKAAAPLAPSQGSAQAAEKAGLLSQCASKFY